MSDYIGYIPSISAKARINPLNFSGFSYALKNRYPKPVPPETKLFLTFFMVRSC